MFITLPYKIREYTFNCSVFNISVGYVQSVSEGYTGGERGILVTPQITSVTESCLSFYLISTKDDTDDTDLDNSVAVYVNDLVYPVAGRQVWKTGTKCLLICIHICIYKTHTDTH